MKNIHSKFKSIVSHINNVSDMKKMVDIPLQYQHVYQKKKISPLHDCCNTNLKIVIDNIDRLYHIHTDIVNNGLFICKIFEMIARMNIDNESNPIYFTLSVSMNLADKYNINGVIYYTDNPYIFMENVNKNFNIPNKDGMYNLFRDEGIFICTPLSLQLQCCKIIHRNIKIFKKYKSLLPQYIGKIIDEYLYIKDEDENLIDYKTFLKCCKK